MTSKDVYLIKTVVHHLRYLRDEWNQNIELDEVIRNSNVLRMLLVDDNLSKVWGLCGYRYPIRLRAFILSSILSKYERERILSAFAGGAQYQGVRWALGLAILGENQQAKHSPQAPPRKAELTLDVYLKIPCMIIRAGDRGLVDINRVELIKYVANKLGGTHIDFRRKVNKPLEQKFLGLDSLHNYKEVDKNIIPYELLSIGQELVGSKHIQRLMKRNV